MNALLDSLASAFDGDAERRAELDAALRDGLPAARSEAWKHTSLRALERRSFLPSPAVVAHVDAALLADIPSPRLVFVNGRFDPRLSDTTGLPSGVSLLPLDDEARAAGVPIRRFERSDEVFARLNTALADDGGVVRIDQGAQLAEPLHLVFVGAPTGGDLAWHSRHLLQLGAGATGVVVEQHLNTGEHAHLGNALLHVQLADGAKLTHARVQDESARATVLMRTDAVLGRDSKYQRIDLELGAALSRHELNVSLEGDGASVSANGVLLADGRRHLDTRIGIEHVARDTACDLLWRGLAAGRGRVVFHGGIVIREGADGADAALSNKNLLLGDNAEIDTQPVLEIHADEVKAAHGATVGQIDPTAMFYLRSRGLPERDAQRLLTAAFCREVVSGLAVPRLRECLEQALDRALARLESS